MFWTAGFAAMKTLVHLCKGCPFAKETWEFIWFDLSALHWLIQQGLSTDFGGNTE
jgi:hypothetical protein